MSVSSSLANIITDGQVIGGYAPTVEQLQQMKDDTEEQQKNEQAEQISQDQKQEADLEDKVLGDDSSQTEQAPVDDNMPYDRIANEQTGNVTPVTVLDEDGDERFPDAQGVFLYNGNERGLATDRLGIIVVDDEGRTTKYMVKRSKVQVGESTSVDEYKQARQEKLRQEQAPVMDNAQTVATSEMQEKNSEAYSMAQMLQAAADAAKPQDKEGAQTKGTVTDSNQSGSPQQEDGFEQESLDDQMLDDVKPVGKGSFGDIYDQFKGNALGAIKLLLRKKSGEAIGALHHKDVGDIDLVWGKEGTGRSNGFGLAKLAKFHPEVLGNLQEILDSMHVTSRSKNRINLESDTHKAAIRIEWDGTKKNWLLTAFKKEETSADGGQTLPALRWKVTQLSPKPKVLLLLAKIRIILQTAMRIIKL